MLQDYLDKLPDVHNNVCISFSGGLDSTVLLHLLIHKYGKDKIRTLSFAYGQRHSVELEMVKSNVERLGINNHIVDITFLGNLVKNVCSLIGNSNLNPKTAEENAGDPQVNTYVPFRNLIFGSLTASFAEANSCDVIAMGLNQVDMYGYWDTTMEFMTAFDNILSLNRKQQIKLIAPFVSSYKEDELLLAKELSVIFGYDILEYTWSCYNGGTKECGKCNTCEEKLKGYILAGYTDEQILGKFDISSDELTERKNLYLIP